MPKNHIFLDCGRFDGVAIHQYVVDDSWEIHSFDVDPQSDLDLPEHQFYQKAVWIEDGEVEIACDPLKQATHIKGVAGTEYEDVIKVPSIDFSKFVADLPREPFIVCSMDIEGAEFPVLRKMIKERTISRIGVLDIEFHHRMMNDEDDESARKLTQELWDLGVVVRLKIVLNK